MNEIELNAIELKVSVLNKCESSLKVTHSFAKGAFLTTRTSDEKLNALLTATKYIYFSGSDTFSDLVLTFFEDEGIKDEKLIEIIGIISLKTISNYVNNFLSSRKHRVSTTK